MEAVREARTADGFAAVYDLHHRRLLRVAYLMRGDLSAAEDDVAEAFSRAMEPWLAGRVEDVAAYLRAAVVNASRTRFRQEQRWKRWADSTAAAPQRSDLLDDRVSDRELLRHALARLPHGQRAVVVLRFIDDASEAATASALGISVGTVKSQTARGLAALRRSLEESA